MENMDEIINDFDYDATGIKMNDGFEPLPLGEYELIIKNVKPTKTKKGFPMVNVTFEVGEGDDHAGRKVWHNVVFMPKTDENGEPRKGAWIPLHFLSCIGEPHEGQFKIKPFNWIGKTVKAKVITETYEGKDRNKIQYFVKPLNGETWASPAEMEAPF